jgi:glycine/D-amino acid oxidase-like deaminating enzyme
LEVEKCVETFCEEAQKNGAELHFEEPLIRFEQIDGDFFFETKKGIYKSKKCVFTCGPWTSQWVGESQNWLNVHRAPLFWFSSNGQFQNEVPCFAYDLKEGFFYGFPEKNGLIKVALHKALGRVLDPSHEQREVTQEEGRLVREFVGNYLKNVASEPVKSALCFYTMSSDQHFILDKLKNCPGAYWAGGFSGHGFKFSSLIGKALSEWVVNGQTSFPIGFLSSKRF